MCAPRVAPTAVSNGNLLSCVGVHDRRNERNLPICTRHIDRPQFLPARAANQCRQIDGITWRLSSSGLAGRNGHRSSRSDASSLQPQPAEMAHLRKLATCVWRHRITHRRTLESQRTSVCFNNSWAVRHARKSHFSRAPNGSRFAGPLCGAAVGWCARSRAILDG